MLSRAALAAIGGYQRHISPRKGYACAYRVAHGGTGCSGFAKHAIRDYGLIRAIPLIRARFSACRDAAKELHEARETGEKRKDRWYDHCHGCDCAGCDLPLRGCGKGKDTTPDGCDGPTDCCHF
jgi:putative component of membrane protein insertase Oxa1/YidC/SpoIIIJ protein YidD